MPKSTFCCVDDVSFLEDLNSFVFDFEEDPMCFATRLVSVQDRFADNQTCRQRHFARMPMQLREAYRRLKSANSQADADMWRKRSWALRKQWIEQLRLKSLHSKICRGRAIEKTKKLHKLDAVMIDGAAEYDLEKCILHVANSYGKKWQGPNLQTRATLSDRVLREDGRKMDLGPEDVANAFRVVKRFKRMDRLGFAHISLQLLFIAHPSDFCQWFTSLMASTPRMAKLQCHGTPFGKSTSLPDIGDIRFILPQIVVMELCDIIISSRLHRYFDRILLLPPDCSCFIGARPKTQPMDIAHTLQTTIEKALDLRSEGAIGQMDIRQFYDSLPMFLLLCWMIQNDVDLPTVFVCFRHQLFTTVLVSLPDTDFTAEIRNRAIGGLTGSRVAGALGRIPVEDMFLRKQQEWKK